MYKTPLIRVLLGRCRKPVGLLVLTVFLILGILTVVKPQTASAVAPSNLNFQARLMNSGGGIVPDGNYNVEFKLYNTATVTGTPDQGACTRNGGTAEPACLWVETRTSGNVVTVKNGYLTVNLGSVTAFGGGVDWSQQMWLSMRIGGIGTPSWDAEMAPRLQLTATPFAMYSANSALLGGLSATGFIQNTTSPQSSSNFNISGTGTAATSLVTPLLDTATSVALNIGATSSVINLNQSTSLAAGKSLTLAAGTGTITQTLNTTSATSGYTLNLTNTSGTQTNGISIVRNGASGITTNGINVTSTAGTLTNGLAITTNGGTIGTGLNITNTSGTLTTGISFTGTFTTLINAPNFSVTNTGIITTATLGGTTGAVAICRNSSNQISSCGINSAGVTLQNAYDASTNPEFTVDSTRGAVTIRDNASAIGGNLFEVQNNAGGATYFGVTATTTTVGGNLNVAANGNLTLAAGTGAVSQTYNGTTAGTANTINITNTSGNNTNGLLINRNGASGTTDSGIAITNTAGTLTSGLSFTGTIGTDINRGSGTLSLNGAGGINLQTAGTTTASLSSAGAANFQNSTDSANGFQIKQSAGAGGAAIFNADTAGSNIQLLGNNAATLSTWTTTTAMTVGTAGTGQQRVRGGAVAANGYLYQVGGNDGASTTLTTVQYAKINADGTVGTWASTTALPATRRQAQPVVANGYIYLIGGRDSGGTVAATSYYAKLNNDGTIGTWNTTTALTSGAGARFGQATVAYNGYMFSIGGFDASIALTNGVYYNKINPDGSLGSTWTSTGANLPSNLTNINNGVVANGYVYLAGGYTGSTVDSIYYAKLNSDGTTGSWSAQSGKLSVTNENMALYVANGYLYTVGGDYGLAVQAFPLSATGAVGTGITLTALPGALGSIAGEVSAAQANGYFYLIGGSSGADGGGTARNTVYYASTPRVQVGGGLDLVGYSGENLNEGGSGGTLTAGNTSILGTLQVQDSANFARSVSVNGDLSIAGNAAIKSAVNATNAFQVQNASGNEIITVDTSGSQVTFGKASTVNAKMVFYNSTNANTVTIQSGVTSGSYSLTLPTAIATTGQCLAAGTVSGGNVPLTFTTCGVGSASTLQDGYNASGATDPQIQLSGANGGLKIRDAASTVGNIFQLQNSAGTVTYFAVTSTGMSLQNSTGTNFSFTMGTNPHLKIFDPASGSTKYADIYFDAAANSGAGEAVFAAVGTGSTTRVGSGSGNIAMQLTNSADVLTFNKTATLSGAYSANDFTITRNLTSGANSETGNVVKIESTGSASGTVSPTLLLINQANSSATGNLIAAQKGGSNVFTVNSAGTVSLAAGQAYTGAGAVSLNSGSATNLTLSAGTTGAVIAKAATNSTNSFQIQDSSSAVIFSADTTNGNIQIGSATTDAVDNLLILDSYNQSTDPTGTNGAMYYNTNKAAFRCYENGAWYNCLTHHVITLGADVTNNNAVACTIADVTGLSFPVTAGVTYRFHAHILYTAAAITTGSRWAVNGPASPTQLAYTVATPIATGSPSPTLNAAFAAGSTYDITGCSTASATTTGNIAQLDGIIQPSASGTMTVRLASEVASSAIVAKAGSTIEWW